MKYIKYYNINESILTELTDIKDIIEDRLIDYIEKKYVTICFYRNTLIIDIYNFDSKALDAMSSDIDLDEYNSLLKIRYYLINSLKDTLIDIQKMNTSIKISKFKNAIGEISIKIHF